MLRRSEEIRFFSKKGLPTSLSRNEPGSKFRKSAGMSGDTTTSSPVSAYIHGVCEAEDPLHAADSLQVRTQLSNPAELGPAEKILTANTNQNDLIVAKDAGNPLVVSRLG